MSGCFLSKPSILSQTTQQKNDENCVQFTVIEMKEPTEGILVAVAECRSMINSNLAQHVRTWTCRWGLHMTRSDGDFTSIQKLSTSRYFARHFVALSCNRSSDNLPVEGKNDCDHTSRSEVSIWNFRIIEIRKQYTQKYEFVKLTTRFYDSWNTILKQHTFPSTYWNRYSLPQPRAPPAPFVIIPTL